MPRYAIIGVEGPHDQAFVQKTLKEGWGLAKFGGKSKDLDPFWAGFIPKYPRKNDLYKPLDMPRVVFNSDLSVAIYAGEGTNLAADLLDTLANHEAYRKDVCAFGLVVDSDRDAPANKARDFAGAFLPVFRAFPMTPGQVHSGPPRTGIFVLPDNVNQGVLEHRLLACGQAVYPTHMAAATTFLDSLDAAHKAHWAPFDGQKAQVATVVSVLKPGKTNTTSIADNDWVSPATLPLLTDFTQFLKDLLDLP